MADLLYKSPKISIIMPVYNSELFLNDTIKSILSQTFRDFELIIINDGSTDSSGEILDAFAEQDDRVRVIHTSNGGPSGARNIGIDNAGGEWIQFMDSDDIIDENMLIELLKASEGVDMVVSGAIRENSVYGMSAVKNIVSARLESPDEIGKYLLALNQDTHDLFMNYLWNRLIKRRILTEYNIRFNENMRLGEDFLFMCELLKHINKINIINQAYYHYINRGKQSLTHIFDKNECQRRKVIYEASCDIMKHFGVYEKNAKLIMENEGRCCWSALLRLNYADDTVTLQDKLKYVKSLTGRENIKYMICYLKNTKNMKSFVKRIILRIRIPLIIYLAICW